MFTRRALALSPIGFLLCSPSASADAELSFPLDMSGPRPTVAISIAGGEPETWIFDTGAGGSVISIDRAQALGLPNNGDAAIGSPAGGVPLRGFRTAIQGALVGGAPLPDFDLVAMPLPEGLGHGGVLSPNVFRGRLVTFDFAASLVRIHDRGVSPPGDPTPYSGGHPLPTMRVTVAGQTYDAHLDTGAPHLISFPYALAASLPLAGAPAESGRARFVDGERTRYRAQISGTVQIGPLAVNDPEISMIDGLPFVNVGTQALRQMVVTLDPERRVSWARLA
jgi:hypothetical protein